MKSFFTRIQNKFDASYGGRYIETILLEISKEDNSLAKLLGRTRKKCYIETEYPFMINGRDRIADIAVLSSDNNELISFIEIKYDDHLSAKNQAQLIDYVEFCKASCCSFLYLTQYYPPSTDLKVVEEAGYKHLLFSDLVSEMKQKNNSQITHLFIDYLEDKGLCMKQIDNDSLYKLLVRLFNPTSGQSKIQNNKSMIEGIPDSLQSLMNNISISSQEISRYIDTKRTPAIDFRVWPYFKFSKKQLREMLEDEDSEYISFLGEKEKYGGEIYIFAKSVIIDTQKAKDDWLYIEYGYKISVDKGESEYYSALYAEIYGKKFKNIDVELYKDKSVTNSTLSSKEKCVKEFSMLISEVSKTAIDHSQNKLYIDSLSRLGANAAEFI